MQTNRKKTRKFLYQKMYSMCFNNLDNTDFDKCFYENTFSFEKDNKYLDEMQKIVSFYEGFFINVIKKYSPKFEVTKMNKSYVLPIYIALGEIFYFSEEIPFKVSINEAVEVAKVYGDNSSKKIVNGILNKVFVNYDELKEEKENMEKYEGDKLFI